MILKLYHIFYMTKSDFQDKLLILLKTLRTRDMSVWFLYMRWLSKMLLDYIQYELN